MKEKLLQFIWQYQLFSKHELRTTNGELVEVFAPGVLNHYGGPDFKHARIKIGATTWAGHVETHVQSRSWYEHKHHLDDSYDCVILHVVMKRDEETIAIPTIELYDRISTILLERYEQLQESTQFVACQDSLHSINSFEWLNWKDRLLAERLQEKTKTFSQSMKLSRDIQEQFYRQMAYNFGLLTNANTFLQLAEKLPQKILMKHKHSLFQIEALLFGVGGFLAQEFKEKYPNKLAAEFRFLQQKYGLQSLKLSQWNFGRIRPYSFPTVRIAQFAALVWQSKNLYSKLVTEFASRSKLRELLRVEPSEYWNTHYVFHQESKPRVKQIGEAMMDNIIINSILPFRFLYATYRDDDKQKEAVLADYMKLKPEKNSILKHWKNLGVECTSAFDSQALLYLYKSFCSTKSCLDCRIGQKILGK